MGPTLEPEPHDTTPHTIPRQATNIQTPVKQHTHTMTRPAAPPHCDSLSITHTMTHQPAAGARVTRAWRASNVWDYTQKNALPHHPPIKSSLLSHTLSHALLGTLSPALHYAPHHPVSRNPRHNSNSQHATTRTTAGATGLFVLCTHTSHTQLV